MALSADPGNLDPQSSAASALFTMNQFAYDPLVSVNGKTGAIESQLATDMESRRARRSPHAGEGRHLL